MLNKINRLQSNLQFQRVYKNSRPVRTANLVVRIAGNSTKEACVRFGFVVSNKIDKRSTRRNALKRQLREIASSLISRLKPGYDVVVVVQKDFSFPYKQEEIKAQIVECFDKIGILLNSNDNLKIDK